MMELLSACCLELLSIVVSGGTTVSFFVESAFFPLEQETSGKTKRNMNESESNRIIISVKTFVMKTNRD
jgi:hypothetical protein